MRECNEAGAEYFHRRDQWELGDVPLPDTDFGNSELSVAEALGAALTIEFCLRRTPDGVDASRPIAVDALLLSSRVSAALLAVVGDDTAANVPKKLRPAAGVLSMASFDLSRCLVGYLVTHPAPDIDAGRDQPNAWLDYDDTALVRRRELEYVIRAHTVMRRLRVGDDSGRLDAARAYAQRIAAIAQVASVEVAHADVPARAREIGRLDPDEVEEARSLLSKAGTEGDQESRGQCLVGQAFLAWIEDGEDNLVDSMLSAAEHLSGRNRISILRTLIGYVTDPLELEAIVLQILETTDKTRSEADFRMRAEALPQVVHALNQIAQMHPERVPDLARRVAGWPVGLTLRRDHLWLIPGFPCSGVIEHQNLGVTLVGLPSLSELSLIARMSNDHAEEFEATVDLGTLRRDLTQAIEPLRDLLARTGQTMTYHAFGYLKHLPLAALTGRGAILAMRPGAHMLAPVPPRASSRTAADERIYVVDRSIAQYRQLELSSKARTIEFDSREGSTTGAENAIQSMVRSSASELVFFCHGDVDQFRLFHSGLVAASADNGFLILPSTAIASQDMSGTELAVALACGAGQGSVFVEPSLSLGYAMRLAGVKIVIAPQWPILAVAAADFLNRFFRLVDDGASYEHAWGAVLASDPNRFISIAYLDA